LIEFKFTSLDLKDQSLLTLEGIELAKIVSQQETGVKSLTLSEKLMYLRKPSSCGFIDEELLYSLPKEHFQSVAAHQSSVLEAFQKKKNENLKKVAKLFSEDPQQTPEFSEQLSLYVQIIKFWWFVSSK
jgi:hypothetical protein